MNTSKSLDQILNELVVPWDTSDLPPNVRITSPSLKIAEAKKAIVEAVEGIYGDSDGLREFASTGSNQVVTLSELLEKFASIESPFDLFEPHLWYGKLGDEGWVCSIRSHHATLWEGSGATPLEAAQACYKKAMS